MTGQKDSATGETIAGLGCLLVILLALVLGVLGFLNDREKRQQEQIVAELEERNASIASAFQNHFDELGLMISEMELSDFHAPEFSLPPPIAIIDAETQTIADLHLLLNEAYRADQPSYVRTLGWMSCRNRDVGEYAGGWCRAYASRCMIQFFDVARGEPIAIISEEAQPQEIASHNQGRCSGNVAERPLEILLNEIESRIVGP